MSEPERVIIQAAVTKTRHPRLWEWWRDGCGDKGPVVRHALLWFFDVRPQLDRIERMLEVLVEEVGK